MSKLRIRIELNYTDVLDVTIQDMDKSVANSIAAEVLEKLQFGIGIIKKPTMTVNNKPLEKIT